VTSGLRRGAREVQREVREVVRWFVRAEGGQRPGIGGGSELGHGGQGDLAQGSGTLAASKTSKARAREGEGVGKDVGACSCDRGGLKRWVWQRRRELCSLVHGGRDHEQPQCERERESERKWRRMGRSSGVHARRG
jgi:hypothetical protein